MGIFSSIRRAAFTSSAALLMFFSGGMPAYAYADEPGPSCTPVTASTGTQSPTGADSVTYTYNACTGLWENPYYTWNPATKETTPTYSFIYVYNTSTGKWDAKKWAYSPARSDWYQVTFSVAQPPEGAQTVGGPEPQTAAASSTAATLPTSEPTSSTTASETSSDTTTAQIDNTLTSIATSGDVTQLSNTIAGNATSGSAQAIANVMNLLQSSSSMGGNVATFVATVDGDVQGNLIIDPSALQPALSANGLSDLTNLDVTISNTGTITNNLALNATSGDVTTEKNTTAGNATSGNAQAIANVVNLVNSMIAANQSFIGVINIKGNLTGDILMPENFLDTLLATNAPHETVKVSQDVINQVSNNITNNVSVSAASGNVAMTNNTLSGNATSGTTTTNVTIFDLTNNHVIAANTMLVFVNVTGTWVGLLMDAPVGSTAAAWAGGVSDNTVSGNTTATSTGMITNNINVSATSGDVTANKNTAVGNVTSGDATALVNIANITNSTFSTAGWFGILFINVFGNWHGSFGVLKSSLHDFIASDNSTPIVFGFVQTDTVSSSTPAKTSKLLFGQASGAGGSSKFVPTIPTATVLGQPQEAAVTKGRSPSVQARDNFMGTIALGAGLFALGIGINGIDYYRTRRNGNGK